jgi:Protein of unknown function (DUF3455)
MKNYRTADNRNTRGGWMTALARAALISTVALPLSARRGRIDPPIVPTLIQVEDGFKPFLVGHAIGTQSYMCQLIGSTVKWTAVGPQATLFDDHGDQILSHFSSPNPSSSPFPTWLDSKTSSAVWAQKVSESSDPAFVAPTAIPWLLLRVNGAMEGRTGADKLTSTIYIHRVNTTGGKEPSTGCSTPANVNGTRVFVPYTADYYFYEYATHRREE